MKDITTEEAIERIHDLIHTCDVGIEKHGAYDDLFALDKQALEKVLDELEKYKELYVKTLGHTLNNSIAQNNKNKDDLEALNEGWKIECEKKDKIIGKMIDDIMAAKNLDELKIKYNVRKEK